MVPKYTVLHINRQVLFGARNQSNHQNFKKSLLSYKFQAKKIKRKKEIQTGRLKKFNGLVLGLVEWIDAKGIDVAQPIWL